jgi:hypothetical protein
VNPNWRPPPPGAGGPPAPGQYPPYQGGYGGYGPRRPPRQEDVILEANAQNPDFAIPGATRGRGRGGGPGRGGMQQPGVIPPMGGTGGRYPGADAI